MSIGERELTALVETWMRAQGVDDTERRGGLRPTGYGSGASVELGRRLYSALWAPMASELGGEQPVLLVPTGPLWMLSFATLPAPNGSRVIDRHPLSYALSLAWLSNIVSRPRPSREGATALLLGHGAASREGACARGQTVSWSALPGVRAEVDAIQRILGDGAIVRMDDDAVLFQAQAWSGSFGILHFATHGIACGDHPLNSFLVLSAPDLDAWRLERRENKTMIVSRRDPGLLPVEVPEELVRGNAPDRLLALALEGDPRLDAGTVMADFQLNADLVVLSACDSGLGQPSGEGVIGMPRAFLAAGARSVVVSQWEVPDLPTTALMTAFYRGYARHGDKALALRDAMVETRKTYPDPRAWAGFVLVGAAE